ncbi:DUF2938 domain-containing protein [Ktedonosporobacter rubrisoli]|uniref:DUF2938 domain-containing protein n=1 Tax=Ktedonosporobacter rubrisoli TaxID=2509675 RepID=A0A4P6JNK0_KTERU|nr:DUF2938 domain-containing protein [Ktedonosporobacter rubrisoli]QBD76888.1 DUF2938 domain-containing protein [Ktedonosporobacter rubrisoli]
MRKLWQWAARAALIGVGATAVMDLGAEVIRRTTGVPLLDYRLVARWIGHMPQGQFRHHNIAAVPPVPAERLLGRVAHYSIGIGFAGLLLACYPRWAERPTLGPAMFIGLGSVAAPFFLMQPAFGLGIAASKTPNPTVARFRSLRAHAIYGFGLYFTGYLLSALSRWRVDAHQQRQSLQARSEGR